MAVRPEGMIADLVSPRLPVDGEKFIYSQLGVDQFFTVPDTRVGRTGAPNSVEFSGTDITASTEDYGLQAPIPNKDINNAKNTNFDPLGTAAEGTSILVDLAREARVASQFTALSNYNAAYRTTLTGNDQWSDKTNSNPGDAILTMLESMLVRPNIGWMGRQVWTKLRQHPKLVAAVMGKIGSTAVLEAAGKLDRRAVADYFELDDLLIGETWVNTAKPGQTASMSRAWGKDAGFCRIDKNVRSVRGFSLPTFAFTAQWGQKISGTINDPNIGLEGGVWVRVGEHVKELLPYADAGCLFKNAVA
ncbi:hypothetical protein [Methylogaea oryzae]|nr:hypothetical protein [Methylogaea oryzae]